VKKSNLKLEFILFIILPFLVIIFPQNIFAQETIFPGQVGQELINSLQQSYTPLTVLSYDVARDTMYAVIDNHNDSLACVYTGYTIWLNPDEDPSGDAYNKEINCEHTWPQSMGADFGSARSNMHHLYPSRVQANSSRSNAPFTEIHDSDTDTWWRDDYSQTNMPNLYIDEYSEKDNDADQFEPREDHKGNVARAMFYFYTIYKSQADSVFFEIQKDEMYQWHYNDPADTGERIRTELVANYQDGKVNPFILDNTLIRRAYFYTEIENPTEVTAVSSGATSILLSWAQNESDDDILIVWNNTGVFSDPQNGVTYTPGSAALGGTIIGRISSESFTHSGLNMNETYYYRLHSVYGATGSEEYSSGVDISAMTNISGTASPGDIVITEIMQNPDAVVDADGEWFEIYNVSETNINLSGWILTDDDVDYHQIDTTISLLIEPGQYMVLGRNADMLSNGGVELDYQYSAYALANTGDEVVLLLPDGSTEIARVNYDDGILWPDPTGASMQFIGNFNQNNNDGELWNESNSIWTGGAGDSGTPGYSNIISDIETNRDFLPLSMELYNYPNPFNPTTTIQYIVETQNFTSQHVDLSIYSIQGQKITTLVSESMHPGRYTINWDGKNKSGYDVHSGIYFINLKTSEGSICRKISLIR